MCGNPWLKDVFLFFLERWAIMGWIICVLCRFLLGILRIFWCPGWTLILLISSLLIFLVCDRGFIRHLQSSAPTRSLSRRLAINGKKLANCKVYLRQIIINQGQMAKGASDYLYRSSNGCDFSKESSLKLLLTGIRLSISF